MANKLAEAKMMKTPPDRLIKKRDKAFGKFRSTVDKIQELPTGSATKRLANKAERQLSRGIKFQKKEIEARTNSKYPTEGPLNKIQYERPSKQVKLKEDGRNYVTRITTDNKGQVSSIKERRTLKGFLTGAPSVKKKNQ